MMPFARRSYHQSVLLLGLVIINGAHAQEAGDIFASIPAGTPTPDPNRVIVTYKDATSYASGSASGTKTISCWKCLTMTMAFSRLNAANVYHRFDKTNVLVASVSPQDAEVLRNDPGVLRVEKDPVYFPMTTRKRLVRRRRRIMADDKDNKNNVLWHNTTSDSETSSHRRRKLQQQPPPQVVPYGIRMVQGNKVNYRGGKTVCVMDTGYDLGHEDLPRRNSQRVAGYTGTTPGSDGTSGDRPDISRWSVDPDGHGTHVTGTIAAEDNSVGVLGVAPGVNLYIVRVFGPDGYWAFESDAVMAVERCVQGGADVVNFSGGGNFSSFFARARYQDIYDNNNVLLVSSAGNGGPGYIGYPAAYEAWMSVAAVDRRQRVASFSAQNQYVELAAPGVAVLSTNPHPALEASIRINGENPNTIVGAGLQASSLGRLTAQMVNCGLGKSVCNNARGKICLIGRGDITFREKVISCEQGGGAAAVIYNNVAGPCSTGWSTQGHRSDMLVMCTTKSQGRALKTAARNGASGTVRVEASDYEYEEFDGTSMACPHAAGVAALVWSHHPRCSNQEIRDALTATAKDVGDPGRDDAYGYGIVKARAALNRLNRVGCSGGN